MKKLIKDLADFFTNLINKIKQVLDDMKIYKIYLYLNSQCVKKVYLRKKDEMPKTYVINVY